jgi:ATP-dependent DNA ligase
MVRSAIIDGEAVVCGEDGRPDFDKLHCQGYDDQVVLYAFDLIELDGDDWRARPLEERKAKLARLLIPTAGLTSTSTSKRTAPPFSSTPAGWVLRASCPRGAICPTARGGPSAGSR